MAAVPGVLRPYVAMLTPYATDPAGPVVHRGLPGTSLDVVLPIGEPVDVGWADGSSRKPRWSTVSGLHPAPCWGCPPSPWPMSCWS